MAEKVSKCKACGLTINAEYKGMRDPATRKLVHVECPDVDPDLQEGWRRTVAIMTERLKEGKSDDTVHL